MAVEIREVIVRAILDDGPPSPSAQPTGGSDTRSSAQEDACGGGGGQSSPDVIVGNVVDQVLRILERRKLR
jgi:Family of unknown function (DUF5908)